MNFEPQKFFIGLVDFFSVLMPGALLTYVLKDWCVSSYLGFETYFPISGTEATVIFLFASYLLGHLAFQLSALLDEWVYDPLRSLTDLGQIEKRLIKSKKLYPRWLRAIVSHLLFTRNADNAVMQAMRIKARALQGLEAEEAVNAFQWCKALLTKDLPEGLATVQRFEADSKFFRSFFVVLGAVGLFYASRHNWPLAALCFFGMLPALFRYIDQRFKATQQAYWLVIMLEGERMLQANGPSLPAAAPRADGMSHAGGVVYRNTADDKVKFMLVGASKNREQRLLPKGHIEPGEDPRFTAVREVREESGHWARVKCWLVDRRLDENADTPMVRWFLLEVCEEPKKGDWRPEDRPFKWFSPGDAKEAASFDLTRELLTLADARLKPPAKPEDKTEPTHQT